jgi:hypothetical protein
MHSTQEPIKMAELASGLRVALLSAALGGLTACGVSGGGGGPGQTVPTAETNSEAAPVEAGSLCAASSLSAQQYMSAGACFLSPVTLMNVCLTETAPLGRSVSAVCGLAPDGASYVSEIGTQESVSSSGWTFVRDQTAEQSIDGSTLSPADQAKCAAAFAAWLPTPRPSCP